MKLINDMISYELMRYRSFMNDAHYHWIYDKRAMACAMYAKARQSRDRYILLTKLRERALGEIYTIIAQFYLDGE